MHHRATSLTIAGVLCFVTSACWVDGELKHDTGVVPEELNDGWELGTPEDVGLSNRALQDIHRQLLSEDHYRGTLSFMVVKEGRLVWETYLRRRSDQGHYNHVQSATKSVTSLLFGIARDQGHFPSLDETIEELFLEELEGLDPRKRDITLEHLLTMRSGLRFDNDDFSVEMWIGKPSNPARYILDKPLYAEPGERYYYRDADPQLLGFAMTRELGKTEEELANETLFDALDIVNYYWEAAPTGGNLAAHGLHLLPRDLAKLGQLLLNRGRWNGEQVVSEAWVEAATTARVQTDTRYSDGRFSYGYYFWVIPDVGFAMWGHGGQFVLVVPAQNMVLVQTAFPDTDLAGGHLGDFLQLVTELL